VEVVGVAAMEVTFEEKRARDLIHPIDRTWEIWRYCPHRFAANIYLGCSHSCAYCFARSMRVDYNTRIIVRVNAPELARRELSRMKGRIQPVDLGSASDPYQPAERKYMLTRRVLEVFNEMNAPCFIVTKSDLVLRDVDLISEMHEKGLCTVAVTITTLNRGIKRLIEPYSSTTDARLKAIEELKDAGVKVPVKIQPILPFLTDDEDELRELVDAVADAGAVHVTSMVLKVSDTVWSNMRSIFERKFPDLLPKYEDLYFKRGEEDLSGYRRAPANYRRRVLEIVADQCKKRGLTFGTCKEGFFDLHTDVRCSGIHLKGRYVPTIENYWRELTLRGVLRIEDAEEIAKGYKVHKKYLQELKRIWMSGKLFSGVPGVLVERADGEVVYRLCESALRGSSSQQVCAGGSHHLQQV